MTDSTVSPQRWIAILGRRDVPTDAVEDYCSHLRQALEKTGVSLELFRVPWAEQGWRRALGELERWVAIRRHSWALVQYTALSWSRRGFPVGFVRLIRCLKRAGANVVIVFHDPFAFTGFRLRDRFRRQVQLAVMRRSARLADEIVSTISPDRVRWMQAEPIRAKALLIPAGSNVPVPSPQEKLLGENTPVVAVFGITEGRREEAALIAQVVSRAAKSLGRLRLIVFGRGAKLAEATLYGLLDSSRVDLDVSGIVSPEQAAGLLATADLQLFVRSGLSSSRGSAIAGIACGLPIIGFSGEETAFPITEAGVRLVPIGHDDVLMRELISVLSDEGLRESLRQRSREATKRYFSWERIAERYLSAIG